MWRENFIDEEQPLLQKRIDEPVDPNLYLKGENSSQNEKSRGTAKFSGTSGVDWIFVKRLFSLMVLARAEGSLVLVALSVINVLVISNVGTVAGSFYKALVDQDLQLFWAALKRSLLWYSAAALCAAVQEFGAEFLVLHWRKNLTTLCHKAYCNGRAIYALTDDARPLPTKEMQAQGENTSKLDTKQVPLAMPAQGGVWIDNPDQRITQEIQNLCVQLSNAVSKTIMAPLQVVYYTWWVWSSFGWLGPAIVWLFFLAGAATSRWVMSPIAALVAKQERLEADFRIAHVRIRENAEAVALYNSSELEGSELDKDLALVLANQRRLLTRHFWLQLVTKSYDYIGAALSYLILAVPVFGGAFAHGTDTGGVAQLISNSAFAILQLIYSFTQLIDTSKVVSDVAGYTSRVAELFEVLGLLPLPGNSHPKKKPPTPPCQSPPGVPAAPGTPPSGSSQAAPPALQTSLSSSLWASMKGLASAQRPGGYFVSTPGMFPPILQFTPPSCRLLTEEAQDASVPAVTKALDYGTYASESGNLNGQQADLSPPDGQETEAHEISAEQGPLKPGTSPPKSLLHAPALVMLPGGRRMEYSVHRIPPSLSHRVSAIFPGVPCEAMLVVPTFQRGLVELCQPGRAPVMVSGGDSSDVWNLPAGREGDSPAVKAEMDALLGSFVGWYKAVRSVLREQGHWVGACNPLTGFSLQVESLPPILDAARMGHLDVTETSHIPQEQGAGHSGSLPLEAGLPLPALEGSACEDNLMQPYCEVYAAGVLLDYPAEDDGLCPVVIHPSFGSRTYPASLFTTAPLACLLEALEAVGGSWEASGRRGAGGSRKTNSQGPSGKSQAFEEPSPLGEIQIDVCEEWHDWRRQTPPRMGQWVQDSTWRLGLGRPDGKALILDKLTCRVTGTGRLIVKDLSLSLKLGESLLIMGPSGCGKTSLLRVLAGLWPLESGSVWLPPLAGGSGVLHLPQVPLLARGGLAAQMSYPQQPPPLSPELILDLRTILAQVGCESLLALANGSFEEEADWPRVLSPGERQGICLARVLYHRPLLSILDEASNSISENAQARIYKSVLELGHSVVTVGHSTSLAAMHDKVLHLLDDGNGGWRLE